MIGVSSPLQFVSAAELRRHAPDEPPWVWRGYLAPGAVTIVAGKPKVGKSTLAFALADALTQRVPAFLGRELDGGPVVYVSEETVGTLTHKLPAVDDLWVLPRDLAWPKPDWGELIDAAAAEAQRVGAVALVIDTLAHWAAMPSYGEKDAGSAQAVMERLHEAASKGVAVLLVMHQRKAGGDDGEGLRGSGAFAGAADIVVELERTQNARGRALLTLSRYPSTPGSLVVNHDAATGAWSVVGEGERGEARSIVDRQAIIAALRSEGELTRAELEQALGSPQRQWAAPLGRLMEEGRVRRSGVGVRGKPHRFSLVRTDAAQPAAQHSRRNGHEPRSDDAAHPVGVQHERGEQPWSHSAPAAAIGVGAEDPEGELRRVREKFPELAP